MSLLFTSEGNLLERLLFPELTWRKFLFIYIFVCLIIFSLVIYLISCSEVSLKAYYCFTMSCSWKYFDIFLITTRLTRIYICSFDCFVPGCSLPLYMEIYLVDCFIISKVTTGWFIQ